MASILSGLFNRRYTIGELMAVDEGRQQKASRCRVSLLNTYYSLKKENLIGKIRNFIKGTPNRTVFYITFKVQVKSDTGSFYNVYLQIDPDFNLSKSDSNPIKVYCGCADFKYRSAYELGRRGSLFLSSRTKSDLGDAYKTAGTGKRGKTLLCKHAYAAVNWLLNNYGNLMKNL